VFCLEGQGNWADFRGSHVSTLFPGDRLDSRIDAFGLFTGQIGYAANNVLFYVKGGAAVTADRFRIFDVPTGLVVATTGDDTRWGASVGTGIEFGFAPNWTAGVEYNHLFMQDRTHTFVDTTGAFIAAERIRQDVDLVTVRVNYRWGGPVIAKY
jgi:outer membrane immunogenic protein